MRIDLRLQRPELGLRDQILHFRTAKLLDLLHHRASQASQYAKILAQVSPSPVTRAQHEKNRITARKAQRKYSLYPPRHPPVPRICYGYGPRHRGWRTVRCLKKRRAQETSDPLRCRLQIIALAEPGAP